MSSISLIDLFSFLMEIHLFSQNGFSIKGRALFHWLLFNSEDCWHFIGDFGRHLGEKHSNFFSECWGRGTFFPFCFSVNFLWDQGVGFCFPFCFVNLEIDLLEGDGCQTAIGWKAPWPLPKYVSKAEPKTRFPSLVHADHEAAIVGKPGLIKTWLSPRGADKLVLGGWEVGFANLSTAQG